MESDAQLRARVDERIEEAVRARGLPGPLCEAVLYATLSPGKRTRPILCLRACEAVGGQVEQALPAAVAIEMIHAFSLVHDDLPAMDDDDLRRGRPTTHVKHGEALAILAGDALQSLALEGVAGHPLGAALAADLARATTEMIAGQVLDTVGGFDDGQEAEQRLLSVHVAKTGALLVAACRMGGRCGDAGDRELEQLERYALAVGLCFQAVDDLLDVTADSATLGKAAGKDAEAGKLTYPGLYGVEGTRTQIAGLREAAVSALDGFGPAADRLRDMARALAVRSS